MIAKSFTKSLSNEDLANILREMKVTGICVSRKEEEYLNEAANRLERFEKVEQWINDTIKKLEDHLKTGG